MDKDDEIIYVYTDGSYKNKTNNGGGIGILLKWKHHEKKISHGQWINTTSARMEIRAILEALRLIKDKTKKVNVYSDNQYCVYAISKGWAEMWEQAGWVNRANSDLWKQVLIEVRLFKQDHVKFNWVRGHNDHEENETCDKLASKGGKLSTLIDDSSK